MEFSSSSSSSPPLAKSRIWVFPLNPPPWTHLFFFIFIIINNTAATSSLPSQYPKNCDHIVPSSNPTTTYDGDTFRSFRLTRGSFTGGNRLFLRTNESGDSSLNILRFDTRTVSRTDTEGLFYLRSILNLLPLNSSSDIPRILSSEFHVRRPRIPVQSYGISFELDGFWSSSSGKLCMVGSGSSSSKEGNVLLHQVVFKLNYPNTTTIYTSLVNGVLESLDLEPSFNYFEPVSILGVSEKNYEYTLIEKESEDGWFGGGKENVSIGLGPTGDVCNKFVRQMDQFELDYSNDECDHHANCNPLGRGFDFLPNIMSFDKIQCSKNQRMNLLLKFSKFSNSGIWKPLDVQKMLVAEGVWDVDKNVLRVIGCWISYSGSLANASVEDCSMRLRLRFSPSLSLRNMGIVEGQVWSNRSENDKDYFARLGVSSTKVRLMAILQVNYEYTEIDNVKDICAKKKIYKNKGSIYPDGNSSDLRFSMLVRNSKGQKAHGYISPLFVNNLFYSQLYYNSRSENQSSPLNISYRMSFTPQTGFKLGQETLSEKLVQFFAEGVYDAQTGVLCMKGCRHLDSYHQKPTRNNTLDCEILVNVRYRPLNSKGGGNVKGTIESTRAKSDPLYFDRLELSSNSISTRQAEESIWRMDLEIAMVLISNTISCLFVGLQLFYVKRHPDVLPFISIIMLAVLTLGHMIPLLLNFEALFLTSRNRQNLFLDDGGWLEVNEVIVRVVTMIAFLLQARLLQQTWSSRLGNENQKNLWVSDKKVLYLSSPLYIFGGSVAWFVHRWKNSFHNSFVRERHLLYRQRFPVHQQNYLWGDWKSYGGLILDGFLLPQILFNLFFNSKEKALAPSFYIGTTAVRLLPHAYDLYRAHSTNWSFDLSYIYANPRMDLYSTAWDVIIPCSGLLFAVLVYLQQRFGGRFFLPKRFRESSEYEKVPVINGE